MRVKEYYLMNDKLALETMQAELSRLQDKWDGEDGSKDIDKDEEWWKESEKKLNEEPF